MSKKVYIAGPMRGYDKFNFPAFDKAANYLRELGLQPINPADLDRVYDCLTDYYPDGFEVTSEILSRMIKRDLNIICDECDAIYMLKGWEYSSGANLERDLAEFIGLEIMEEV